MEVETNSGQAQCVKTTRTVPPDAKFGKYNLIFDEHGEGFRAIQYGDTVKPAETLIVNEKRFAKRKVKTLYLGSTSCSTGHQA